MKLTIGELLDIEEALIIHAARLEDRAYDTGNPEYQVRASRIDNLRAKVAVLLNRRGDVQ